MQGESWLVFLETTSLLQGGFLHFLSASTQSLLLFICSCLSSCFFLNFYWLSLSSSGGEARVIPDKDQKRGLRSLSSSIKHQTERDWVREGETERGREWEYEGERESGNTKERERVGIRRSERVGIWWRERESGNMMEWEREWEYEGEMDGGCEMRCGGEWTRKEGRKRWRNDVGGERGKIRRDEKREGRMRRDEGRRKGIGILVECILFHWIY